MGFFDNLKEKATDLAQAGVAQSKRVAEIAKLKAANLGEEDNIKKAYVEIGKLYYAEKGLSPEGAYAAACEKITAAKAAIEANNDRIAELKVDSGTPEVVAEAQAVIVDDGEITADDFADDMKEAVEDFVDDVKEEAKEIIEEIKD